MKICGLQKLTLLDFPGKTACTVFTSGCNLRCPFCHNAGLVTGNAPAEISETEFFDYISKRKGVLDGVAITGGEPLLQKDISAFISKVHDMGFAVKLDTNGFFPTALKNIIEAGNVSYIAMDIKNTPEKYGVTTGIDGISINNVLESIKLIMSSGIDYEFRTTATAEYHKPDDFLSIAEMIRGAKAYYLQAFKDSGNLIQEGNTAESKEKMEQYLSICKKYVEYCAIRGI